MEQWPSAKLRLMNQKDMKENMLLQKVLQHLSRPFYPADNWHKHVEEGRKQGGQLVREASCGNNYIIMNSNGNNTEEKLLKLK